MAKAIKKFTPLGILGSVLKPKGDSSTPAATPTPVMPEAPDSNDPIVRAAKLRKAAELQNRSGRLSTMLSDGSGGGSSTLG